LQRAQCDAQRDAVILFHVKPFAPSPSFFSSECPIGTLHEQLVNTPLRLVNEPSRRQVHPTRRSGKMGHRMDWRCVAQARQELVNVFRTMRACRRWSSVRSRCG